MPHVTRGEVLLQMCTLQTISDPMPFNTGGGQAYPLPLERHLVPMLKGKRPPSGECEVLCWETFQTLDAQLRISGPQESTNP